jgi:hypothetical protein
MKTHDLIGALAQDHAGCPAPQPLSWTFLTAMAAGFGVAVVAFALTLGIRPDAASAILTWRYDFKFVVTLTLAVTSARFVWRLARPAADARTAGMALLAAPMLLCGAVLYELWAIPPSGWLVRAIGANSAACVASIALLSIAPLIAAFVALRRSAPLNPGLAGAAAGLLASALAAMLYAMHCPDDSPLFGAIWYTIAMVLVAAGGGAAGRRFLRW